VEAHLKDLQRLDRQAAYVYDSASRLLDLKQKHANPFEARLAREQAAGAARTGKSVMIFTIVTIIFLPISFITSFFTIEIAEFPRTEGSNALQLSFVMKYIIGVGFAVSIPLIVVAFVAPDWNLGLRGLYERFQDRRRPVAPPAESAPIKEPEGLSV
jgi:Mg2+ and Co2+ transporter CorA